MLRDNLKKQWLGMVRDKWRNFVNKVMNLGFHKC